MIASLSIPWSFAKRDDDLRGYHLVWPGTWWRRSGRKKVASVIHLLDFFTSFSDGERIGRKDMMRRAFQKVGPKVI
jgi:hypothetical protein